MMLVGFHVPFRGKSKSTSRMPDGAATKLAAAHVIQRKAILRRAMLWEAVGDILS
jgi:hypothetical protein